MIAADNIALYVAYFYTVVFKSQEKKEVADDVH